MTRQRLDHVDAMRPVKQAGVVSTHSLLFFAPGAAIGVGGALTLLHVTREAFLFISACMLTYGYYDLRRSGYRRYYRRRVVSVVLPYVAWTVIYFFVTMPTQTFHTPWDGVLHFGYLTASGYYQLYYLIVIMQFYLVFPAALWLLRRLEDHHVALLVASLCLQVLVTGLMHWNVLPPEMRGFWASREITSYQFYLLAGMVAARHLDDVHAWLWRNGWRVFAATCVAAAAAELWFVAGRDGWVSWLGSGSDPFQPVVIPYNIGAIACLYLFGVWLVDQRRPRRIRVLIRSGSDNAYGIYLAQMVFISFLSWVGFRALDHSVPWPLTCVAAVTLVVGACVFLTGVLARTPLSVVLTGRQRERWSTWLPQEWRRVPEPEREESVSPLDVDDEDPAGSGEGALRRVGVGSVEVSSPGVL